MNLRILATGLLLCGSICFGQSEEQRTLRLRVATIEQLAASCDGEAFGSGERSESTIYMGSWNEWHRFEYNMWFEDKEGGQAGSSRGQFRCKNLKLVSLKTGKEVTNGTFMRVADVDIESRTVLLDSSAIDKVVEDALKEFEAEQGVSGNPDKPDPRP